MVKSFSPSRRQFFQCCAGIATWAVGTAYASDTRAIDAQTRGLSFKHTHTNENISLIYSRNSRYLPQALDRLNFFLRDHYTGDVGNMDPALFDVLHRITIVLNTTPQSFHVISGYRCPATNSRLRAVSAGGVATHSLHMDGKAIDIRLPDVPLARLRDAALSLRAGGVGYYPREQFVHIDTGKVRQWG